MATEGAKGRKTTKRYTGELASPIKVPAELSAGAAEGFIVGARLGKLALLACPHPRNGAEVGARRVARVLG
jgi:hypothetical protein